MAPNTPLQKRLPALQARENNTLHAIACFEALKGFAALAASVGLLSLAHHDIRAMAYALIGHFHLDPDAHYPKMLLNNATLLANANLQQAVLLAWAYAAVRLTRTSMRRRRGLVILCRRFQSIACHSVNNRLERFIWQCAHRVREANCNISIAIRLDQHPI